MRLTGFSGCRVVSCSLVVSGTLHEHQAHKNNNVKAKMEIHLVDGGEQRRSENCEIDASLLSQKKALTKRKQNRIFCKQKYKAKEIGENCGPNESLSANCPLFFSLKISFNTSESV